MQQTENLKSAIDTIADLAIKANSLKEVEENYSLPSGQRLLILKDGTALTVGEATADDYGLKIKQPSRIKASTLIQTVDSMVEYLARYKEDGTTLFADISQNQITGVIDFHKDGKSANFTGHVATMSLPYSEEWKLWQSIHNKLMPQLDFGRWLQENRADIKAPDAGTLMDAVNDLQAKRTVNFTKAVHLNSDNESFEFTDNTEAKTKGGLSMPTEFLLQIPVYFGSRTVEQAAFLRWKLDEGQLNLGVYLSRAEQVRQAMFKEIVEDIASRAEVPVIYGKANLQSS